MRHLSNQAFLQAGARHYSLQLIKYILPKKRISENFCRIYKYARIAKAFGQFNLKSG